MQIITGYTGENHVTSADDASLYRGIIGIDDCVLDVGKKFEASIIDNNTVRIMDGDLLIQGYQGRIRENDYNEVTIDNGTPGQKRNDLIVARYFKNTETGIESISLEVVKGTPGTAAVDPEIIQEDLKIGGTQRDYPLYRAAIDGISLTNLTTLFNVVPTLSRHLAESVAYPILFTRDATLTGVQNVAGLPNRTPQEIVLSAEVRYSKKACVRVGRQAHVYLPDGTWDARGEHVAIAESTIDATLGEVTFINGGIDISWRKVGAGATGTISISAMLIYHD